MHYYQFNIGDYSKDAKHLTLEEDAIYRRLIDLYYLSEQPIPLEINIVSKKILARSSETLIIEVLNEFFKKTEKGFEHSRIKKDIKIYKNNKKNKVKAAKARWAKVPGDADAMHVHSKRNANHKPLTINHKPLTKDQKKVEKEFTIPGEINHLIWHEFEQHRKEINKPMTDLARTKNANILKKLSHDDQRYLVDYSIGGRYTGLFPEQLNKRNHNERNQRSNTGSNRNLSAVDRVKRATANDRDSIIDITPHGYTVDQDG